MLSLQMEIAKRTQWRGGAIIVANMHLKTCFHDVIPHTFKEIFFINEPLYFCAFSLFFVLFVVSFICVLCIVLKGSTLSTSIWYKDGMLIILPRLEEEPPGDDLMGDRKSIEEHPGALLLWLEVMECFLMWLNRSKTNKIFVTGRQENV